MNSIILPFTKQNISCIQTRYEAIMYVPCTAFYMSFTEHVILANLLSSHQEVVYANYMPFTSQSNMQIR